MKWKVKQWLTEGYQAKRPGALTAYVYRSLRWPSFYRDPAPAFEVKYSGVPVATISFEGKGATVRALAEAARFPELSDLDLVEIALWVSKLRSAGSVN